MSTFSAPWTWSSNGEYGEFGHNRPQEVIAAEHATARDDSTPRPLLPALRSNSAALRLLHLSLRTTAQARYAQGTLE